MNRLDALKYFIVAGETLSFKNTAVRFSVSPQVISRVISELEDDLGEALFKRNTRAIRLTDFGSRFLPKAMSFLQQEEALFGGAKTADDKLSGMVRITLPPSVFSDEILFKLLTALEPYPQIQIDWRTNFEVMKTVDDQIDIGIRISRSPDEHWIAKQIGVLREPIVAAPELIARTGLPKDIEDLVQRFPVGNVINPHTGKVWDWFVGEQPVALPKPSVAVSDVKSLLQAVLAGRIFAPITLNDCRPYLASKQLQVVFDNAASHIWHIYLYRPYQVMTPKRVLLVFELLENILAEETV